MNNKIKILAGILTFVVLLTIGLTSAVFADPQDENGYLGPGYCSAYYHGNNGDYAARPGYGGWYCR